MPCLSIEDEGLYENLCKQGNSEDGSAPKSAAAPKMRSSLGKKGRKSGAYEGWANSELKKRAKELGISGYSDKKKDQLVILLRNYSVKGKP